MEAGGWSQWSPSEAEIPATYGLENGVWFKIRRGMRGVLVLDPTRNPIVYMICAPSTRYYRVMTRSARHAAIDW